MSNQITITVTGGHAVFGSMMQNSAIDNRILEIKALLKLKAPDTTHYAQSVEALEQLKTLIEESNQDKTSNLLSSLQLNLPWAYPILSDFVKLMVA